MKIITVPYQTILPKHSKKEHAAEAVDTAKQLEKQQQSDAKQALREAIQRQMAEMQAARSHTGEDNPKVQQLIEKFKSGKKLTSDEIAYVRQNAPGMMDYIDRISREREIVEQSMRNAPSKMDVHHVVVNASKQIAKHQSSEERVVRARQIADAQYEYMQTDEYKEKPNSPLDNREKQGSPRCVKENPIQHTTIAVVAYEQAKSVKSKATAITLGFSQDLTLLDAVGIRKTMT